MTTYDCPPCQVLVVDPPWAFGDKLPGGTRGAAKNYRVMKLPDLLRMPLPSLADDALLFLWRVSAMPEEALQVVRAWGFVPKSEFIWLKKTVKGKQHFGMGRYVRLAHEGGIIAARGKGNSLIVNRAVRSVFEGVVKEHSEKPDEFFQMVNTLVGDAATKVELFARKRRAGWHCYGDELPDE